MTLTYEKLLEAQRRVQGDLIDPLAEHVLQSYVAPDLPKVEKPYYRIFPVHPLVMWLRRWFPAIKPWVWVYAPRLEEAAFVIGGRIYMSPAMFDHLKRISSWNPRSPFG